MLCKSSIGLRLAITNEDAEDSAESSTDEEEEAAGEEERSVSLNSFSFLMFYKTWKFNNLRYCTFKRPFLIGGGIFLRQQVLIH